MKKLLVIVDMQKDFIDGSLANKDAKAIVPGICDLIKEWEGDIVCTLDTHVDDYLESQEGKHLPVEHCIYQKEGWLLDANIRKAISEKNKPGEAWFINKPTFGSVVLGSFCEDEDKEYDEVIFVGTCTDICVVSNVLLFKAFNPETPLAVYADLCAGLTPEKHEAALNVMQSCQVDIRYYTEGK